MEKLEHHLQPEYIEEAGKNVVYVVSPVQIWLSSDLLFPKSMHLHMYVFWIVVFAKKNQ